VRAAASDEELQLLLRAWAWEQLRQLYAQHNPTKLPDVHSLLEKYRDDLLTLVQTARSKYRLPPVPPDMVSAAWAAQLRHRGYLAAPPPALPRSAPPPLPPQPLPPPPQPPQPQPQQPQQPFMPPGNYFMPPGTSFMPPGNPYGYPAGPSPGLHPPMGMMGTMQTMAGLAQPMAPAAVPPPPLSPAPPLVQQALGLSDAAQHAMGTDEVVSALRQQLASTCDRNPQQAMADRQGIVLTVHTKPDGTGTGSTASGNLDFGYVPIDEQAALQPQLDSTEESSSTSSVPSSSGSATKRGAARFVAVPSDSEPKPEDNPALSRYVKIKNTNAAPVTMQAVEFIPDYERFFEILLPPRSSDDDDKDDDNDDDVSDAAKSRSKRAAGVPLKRERRGGKLLARLTIKPQSEVMLQVRCRPAETMRFYATWMAMHFEISRQGNVLDSLVHSCAICRKVVAVAIRKSEITTLNAEAKQFVPRFLQNIFDTPLHVHRLVPSQAEQYPPEPDVNALEEFRFSAMSDQEAKAVAAAVQQNGIGSTSAEYQAYFAKLLRLEEQQMERDITMYNMYNQVLKPVRGSPDAVTITVKGAAEHRPALTFGDSVRFRVADAGAMSASVLPAQLGEWEGRVVEVRNTTVTVQLCNERPTRWMCGVCAKRGFFLATPCGCHVCENCLRGYILHHVNTVFNEEQKAAFTTTGKVKYPAVQFPAISPQSELQLREFGLKDLRYSTRSELMHHIPRQEEWNKFARKKAENSGETVLESDIREEWARIENEDTERYGEAVAYDGTVTPNAPEAERLFLTCSGVKVHVRFTVNRLAIRHMYRALAFDVPRIWPRLQGYEVQAQPDAAAARASRKQLSDRDFQWTAKAESQLNTEQVQAIRCIVNSTHGQNPMVVFGPPGTGKTLTMVEAVVQILANDPHARILCTGPSDSSADTFAERLVTVGKEKHAASHRLTQAKICRINSPQRLGGISAVKTELLPYCTIKDGRFVVPEADVLAGFDVVVSTCAGAGLLQTAAADPDDPSAWEKARENVESGSYFTHIFIDEASQAMEPESLVAIALGGEQTKLVMAGDHKQLGVSVRSVRKTPSFLSHLYTKPINLPRQARDNARKR
jgi:hypothetical protein